MTEPGTSKGPSLPLGALLGFITTLPLMGLSYLGERTASLPFVPFDVFDWLARALPGSLVIRSVEGMVGVITALGLGSISSTAKHLEQLQSLVLVAVAGILVGLALALALRRHPHRGRVMGAWFGLAVFVLVAAIELALKTSLQTHPVLALGWLALLIVGWGAVLGSLLASPQAARVERSTPESRLQRRSFVAKALAGAAAIALGGWGLAKLVKEEGLETGSGLALSQFGIPETAGKPDLSPPSRGGFVPAPGARPEVTPTEHFYRIDINTRPPVIDQAGWKMEAHGLFERPRMLNLHDIMAYAPVTQAITLCCISNPVAGDLISTAYFTGAPLRDVLQDLGVKPEARTLLIRSADHYWEYVTAEDMMDPRTLLVYGMNGETLPAAHGFPLRIYIPNRYGMKQPKWITSLEAVDHAQMGYWVERGWSREARPQVLSIIDVVAKNHVDNGRVPVGGIAWAGDRGIRKVEVQVDEGPWEEAVLHLPALSPLTWVQWRYDWPLQKGRHTFRVRATDGAGALQTEAPSGTFPNGATGFHQVRVNI